MRTKLILCLYNNIIYGRQVNLEYIENAQTMLIHQRNSDGDIREYASLDSGMLLKTKVRKEIYSCEPESKFPKIRIFLA